RGEAIADIPSNGKGTVEIRAESAGLIIFESATAPGGRAGVEVSENGCPWHSTDMLNPSSDDEPLNDWVTVVPGRVHWRVRFPAEGNVENPRQYAEPQEGEVTVGAGERVTVHVPIVPKPR
ncbi:MAG: hypothetical protein HYR85_08705, partial [Planctomycetes bacterium]|nr:hypothetical protein [Planctomycetota bacterium]